MAITINSSVFSLRAQRQLNETQGTLSETFRRLSSGIRIGGASDDPGRIGISVLAEAKQRSLRQSIRNLNDGISLSQTLEGGLAQLEQSLQRLRELSVQASSETLSVEDRSALQAETDQIITHMDKVVEQTKFNGVGLLDGSAQGVEIYTDTARGTDSINLDLIKVTPTETGRKAKYTSQRRGVYLSDIDSGDLKINGVSIRATDDTDDPFSYSYASGSAIAKANAINAQSENTGVTARVAANVIRANRTISAFTLDTSNYFSINGQAISGMAITDYDADGKLLQAINAVSEESGVVGSLDSQGQLVLTAEDGRNIQIHYSNMFTLIAIGLADTSGDETNLKGQVLKSSVYPVDLFGSIQNVQSDFLTYGGNVGIGGEFDRGDDHVDYVAQVIKGGNFGTAEFRIGRQTGSEISNVETYGFLDVDGPYTTGHDANMEYFALSQETTNNGIAGTISSTGQYNEGADRTYTITVTQEGSTDGSQKAVGDISSNVDGVLHSGVTLEGTITLGTALRQTGEFVTLTLGATPRGQSVDESGNAQPYSQAITQNGAAVGGVKITGTYVSDVDMIKEVRVVETGYTQGINKAKLQVFNSVNGGAASAQGAAFEISTGAPIDIGNGLFIEFTPMAREFNMASGSVITNSGTAGSFDTNGFDMTLTSSTLDFVGERGDGTYSVYVTEAGKTGNAKYEVLFNGNTITSLGERTLSSGSVDVADGITFNLDASTPEIGATTANVTPLAGDHYGALADYQSPKFKFQGTYTGDMNDTTAQVEVIQEGRVLGASELSTGDAAVLRYTIAGTSAGPTITATTFARATTYNLGEGVQFKIDQASAGTQINVGGVDVNTSHSFGPGAILGYNGNVSLNLDQALYDLPTDLTLRLSEVGSVVVGHGTTSAQGQLQAALVDSGGTVVASSIFAVNSGAVNKITDGLSITFDSTNFNSLDFVRDTSTAQDGGTMSLSAGAVYNNSLGDKEYEISFSNVTTQTVTQTGNGPNSVNDVAGSDVSTQRTYTGLFGDQTVTIAYDGTTATTLVNHVNGDDGTSLTVLGTYNGLSDREIITVTYEGTVISPSTLSFANDSFNVQAEAGAYYNGISGAESFDVTFSGEVTHTINPGDFSGTVTVQDQSNFNRGDLIVNGLFTDDNELKLTINGIAETYSLSDGANLVNLGTLGFGEINLNVNVTAATVETNQTFTVNFNRSQKVDISDGTQTVSDIDISSGKIDLGHADLVGAGKIFSSDPGFDLDASLSNNGITNKVSFNLSGPQARVQTGFGGGDATVDISGGLIDFSDSTFNGFFTDGDPGVSLNITNPLASVDDKWTITLDKVDTVSLTTSNGTVSNKLLSNDPGNRFSFDFDDTNPNKGLTAAEKTTLFGSAYDSTADVNVKVVFETSPNQIDDVFELNLGGTPTINIKDTSLSNSGTDYVISTALGSHTFDLNGILETGKDPGFDIIIDDPIKGFDDSYTLTLKQSELVAANTDLAELNVKSLQVGDRWQADLIADTLEVGTRYNLGVTAPHLNNGHIYEIEENVGTLKVGEKITVGSIDSAYEPTVYTLNSSVTITDGLNINFSSDGNFEVGDEIRFQARGYRGDYSVFGQYTDPAYPTTFEVEVTTTGDVDGAARLKVTRLDKNEVIATNIEAVSVADVGNIGGAGYLELGVFMQFDAHNGAGEAHRLYQGDKFYIDVVGSLSQNFASQIILESEDNIAIEYSEINVDNNVGRFLYVGDLADVNSPGTLNSLQSANLGLNTEFSVAKLDMTSQEEAEESMRLIDEAIERISAARVKTGAAQSRMNREIISLEESAFQTERYLSRIRDADFAQEVARQTRALIVQRASTQVLSQINNFGQYGLQLVQSLTR